LEQLAAALPSLKQPLSHIVSRLWDLFPIVRDHYYHPAFDGSYSIKSVLPALVPSLAYDDLAIKEGGHAASQYYRMVFVETDWVERATIEEVLLRYCARDTLDNELDVPGGKEMKGKRADLVYLVRLVSVLRTKQSRQAK
jgi:hypothetical protein